MARLAHIAVIRVRHQGNYRCSPGGRKAGFLDSAARMRNSPANRAVTIHGIIRCRWIRAYPGRSGGRTGWCDVLWLLSEGPNIALGAGIWYNYCRTGNDSGHIGPHIGTGSMSTEASTRKGRQATRIRGMDMKKGTCAMTGFAVSTLQRFNASTLQRFNASTLLQRFNVLQR